MTMTKPFAWLLLSCVCTASSPVDGLRITALTPRGDLFVTNSFTNGVLTIERAATPGDAWTAEKNVYSLTSTSRITLSITGRVGAFRARAVDLSGAQGEWTLGPEDFIDLPSIALRLAGESDPVSEYVAGRLSGATTDLLFSYTGGDDPELRQALADDLNGIIQGGPIYDDFYFGGVTLSPPTQALLAQGAQGEALVHLNRLLLEDAYPQELRQKRTAGFTNLVHAYGLLTTIAGNGNIACDACNNWREDFEGAPAADVILSSPHIAMADRAGNIYIADKRAHGIRKVTPDGRILTVAGTSQAGRGDTDPTPATSVALNNPNGLWVMEDGTFYILDRDNGFIRKVDTNGIMTTPIDFGSAIPGGRGLWVSADESVLFFSAGPQVMVWDSTNGLASFATGFAQAGNLAVDPKGRLVVTDSDAHRVVRIESDGSQTVIAGNGMPYGGGDGQLATQTGLFQVRAIWFLASGAFFVGTDAGGQVWYVDVDGHIHLFLNGDGGNSHAGDGAWFYDDPATPKVNFVKQITMDYEGNLLITESASGYVRKIRFLPLSP